MIREKPVLEHRHVITLERVHVDVVVTTWEGD
jgi:hypothetical protein